MLERKKTLLTDHIELLRKSVREVKNRLSFHIDGWVVLPDHMHCIWTLPLEDSDFSGRWREIKKGFSKALPKTERLSPVRIQRKERSIWQRLFWEHVIRDDKDYMAHMDYLHFNPVKHGFVEHVRDWPHSSFHKLVKNGIYPEDWASCTVENMQVGE